MTWTSDPEIIGWRVWNVDLDQQHLLSATTDTVWLRSRMHAQCYSFIHDAPADNCSCGLWATRFTPPALAPILGLVRLWGNIVVHGREGWRAEYARPVALVRILYPSASSIPLKLKTTAALTIKCVDELASVHGLPVIDLERPGWQAVAKELGAPSISWLQPLHQLKTTLVRETVTVSCTCGWVHPRQLKLNVSRQVLMQREAMMFLEHCEELEHKMEAR